MKNLLFLFTVSAVISSQIVLSQEAAKTDSLALKLLKARELAMQGEKAEASDICLKIMQSSPDNKAAVQWWVIANMERSQQGEEKMAARLDSLSRVFPANTGILFFKSFIQAEYGKNEEALAGFGKLITLQPDSSVNWIGKGQVLSGLDRHREALTAFEKAVSLDPKRYDAWNMKAMEQSNLGMYDDAITSLTRGIEINPNFPVNFYNRACIYSLKGDKVNALADLKKAITLNPGFRENAPKDEDFKSLWEDEEFKKLLK